MTKSLISLMNNSPNGVADINEAATRMCVDKRRIYDIVNIMEGAGVVQRLTKTSVKMRTQSQNDLLASRQALLESEIADLSKEENYLDQLITSANDLMQVLTRTDEAERYPLIETTHVQRIASLADQTVIVIKSPPGSLLTVPYPDE
ncbi:predicted protein, partial [Nematostella vectensis]